MYLFQDICSNYVYSYANSLTTPVSYNSQVGGILTNGAVYDSCNGAINGNDLSLNALNSQYMSIQQIPIFPVATDGSGFSFSGWFYPVGTQISPVVLFDLSGAGLARSSVLYNGSNTLSTYYNGGNGGNTTIGNVSPSISITPGQWHFFCYTVRCTNVSGTFMAKESLYVDANCMTNQFSTDTTTLYVPFTIQSGTIGGKPTVAGSYFHGRMSEMRYYGRVLTNPEIQVLYNMQNYINYQTKISITNPSSIQGKYNSINGAIIQNGLGQYGASVQIDLSGTFSYMDVSRNPGFNGGTTRTISNLYASALMTTSPSLTVDQSGNVFFVDATVLPNQTYTYVVKPYIRDISNAFTTVTTSTGAITITTPAVTIQPIYDISAGAQTSKTTGMFGSMIQVDISGGIYSILDISRNPPFSFSTSPPAPTISPGIYTSATGVLDISVSSVLNSPSTQYQAYLLNTILYVNPSNPTLGTPGLAFVDMTAVPGVTYTYSFTPLIMGSALTKTPGTVQNPGSITTPPVTVLPLYDISAGAIIGKTVGKYGASVQIDLSGSYTYADVSRNPPFSVSDLSLLAGATSYRIYDASASLTSIDNAYITNTLAYTNASAPTTGVISGAFVDNTTKPNTTYSYYVTPSIKGTNGAITTTTTTSGATTITTPAITIQPLYDISAGAIIGKTVGKYGASVQIDLSGSFTYSDVSRNPPFSASDLSLLAGTTSYRIYDASASLTLSSTDNSYAYITNALSYTNASLPTVGVIGEVFVDKTAYPNTTYSYYVTPSIKGTNGSITTVVTSVGVTTITTPAIIIQPLYDISAGAIIGRSVGKYGASVQIDLSGSFTYADVSRNPPFSASDLSLLAGATSYRIYDASASLSSTDNAYITNTLAYTNASAPTTGVISGAFVDNTVYPNTSYSYYLTPSIKGTNGAITATKTSSGATAITTPPVTLLYVYFDPTYGVILTSNTATIQIDLNGNFTGVDITRNPPFPTSFDTPSDSTLTSGILRLTYASSLTTLANNTTYSAYLTNTITHTSASALAFIDKTVSLGNQYTYYVTPYIQSVSGITYQVTNLTGTPTTISTTQNISDIGTVDPALIPTPGTVSTTNLDSTSIPGITIGSGTGTSAGSGAGTGTGTGTGTDSGTGTGTGSAGTVTSSTLTGGSLDGTGISATGGTPVLPSPPAGVVSLASGAVSSLYTGTLPSTVSSYFVASMNSTGSTTISQAKTILAPPAGFSGASGTVSFYAWPSSTYDTGTTMTVTMGGVTLLSGYAFSGANAPYTIFNLPFVNVPPGNASVNITFSNTNGSSNSQICFSGVNVNYSYVQGSGTTVIDTSNLALYYPLDSSAGTLLSNYATGNSVTDASLCSGAVINTTGIKPCIGLGDVSFNNTLGSYAQLGQWTCPPATTVGNGFTIAGWFYSTGTQVSNATLCTLSNNTNRISIFLNQNNMLLDFSCNGTNGAEYISTSQVYNNIWNFFVMTCRYNGTTATNIYYINDVSLQTVVGAYPSSSPVYTKNYLGGVPAGTIIPANNAGNLGAFNGHIDDFRVYSRVLGFNEIQSLWVYGFNSSNINYGNVIDPTGLIMYYTFELNASVNPPLSTVFTQSTFEVIDTSAIIMYYTFDVDVYTPLN